MRKKPAKKKRGLTGTAGPSKGSLKTKSRAAAGAPAAAAVPALPAPTPIPGFSTGADLAQINDFLTQYATSVEDIDNALSNQLSDTKVEKTKNDKNAKVGTVQTADEMAGRGIFQSSVKDAALYDIEAQRALSNKFLDDKMTQATLQAGTRKRTLAEGKKRFDTAMLLRKGENAASVNDPANQAWADKKASQLAPPKPKVYKPPKPKGYKPPKPKKGKSQLQGTATITGMGLK